MVSEQDPVPSWAKLVQSPQLEEFYSERTPQMVMKRESVECAAVAMESVGNTTGWVSHWDPPFTGVRISTCDVLKIWLHLNLQTKNWESLSQGITKTPLPVEFNKLPALLAFFHLSWGIEVTPWLRAILIPVHRGVIGVQLAVSIGTAVEHVLAICFCV